MLGGCLGGGDRTRPQAAAGRGTVKPLAFGVRWRGTGLTNPLSRLADRLGMPVPHHPQTDAPQTQDAFRPTPGQLALLRRLTYERGATIPWPRTRSQADRAISRLSTGGAR